MANQTTKEKIRLQREVKRRTSLSEIHGNSGNDHASKRKRMSKVLTIRCHESDYKKWVKKAEAINMDLNQYVRLTMNRAKEKKVVNA